MAAGIPDHRDVKFPPEALEYRRRLVEQAPPLTPEQAAIIRTCFTKPRLKGRKSDAA